MQGCRASMGPQLYRCGNITNSLWVLSLVSASMGPQLYRCGNAYLDHCSRITAKCFNGAATLSLRNRSASERLFVCGCFNGAEACFNGAATLSLRKSLARNPH